MEIFWAVVGTAIALFIAFGFIVWIRQFILNMVYDHYNETRNPKRKSHQKAILPHNKHDA